MKIKIMFVVVAVCFFVLAIQLREQEAEIKQLQAYVRMTGPYYLIKEIK